MADLTKIVSILFEADDKMSASLSQVSSSFDQLDSKLTAIASPFADLADRIIKLDAALAAMAIGGATYAVGKFAEFEDRMLTVKGVMQASDADYERLTELTKGLGETTRYTAEQAAEGLQYLAMAGMKTDEAIGALPEVLKLAQAANVDLGQSADIVTNIMAGYGKQVSELAEVNDVLVATFTNSNTNLTQLYEAFKYAGPVAKAMGIDIADLAATLGVLANAGYQGEMGGTAMRNILVALAEPTKEMSKLLEKLGVDTSALGVELGSGQKAMESLGVKVKDANGNMRPMVDIIADLQTGIQKIHDPVDQAAILMEVFGKRGGPQMAALLTQGADSIKDLEEKIKSAGGITNQVAAEMESGIGGAMRSLVSAIEAVTLNIGEKLKEGAKPAAEGATTLFRAIAEAVDDGQFDVVFAKIGEIGADLGDALQSIAKNLPEALEQVDFTGLLDAFGDVGETIRGFFEDDIDLATIEGLTDALQGAVDFLTGLVKVTNGMAEAMGPIFKTIVEGIQAVAHADKEQTEMLGNILGASKLIVSLGGGVVAALAAIQQSGAEVGRVYDVVAGSVKAAWNTLQTGFDSIVLLITESVIAILDSVNQITFGAFSEDIGRARENVESFRQAVAMDFADQLGDLGDGLEQIGRGFTGAGDSAEGAAEQVDQVTGALQRVPEQVDTGVSVFLTGDEEVDSWLRGMHDIEAIAVSTFLEVDHEKTEAGKQELTTEVKRWKQELVGYTESGVPIYMTVDAESKANVEKSVQELKKKEDKEMEIRLKGEIDTRIAEIKAGAETVQKAVEWTAKLNIAQAEAEAKKFEAMMTNTAEVIGSLGGVVADMFSAVPKDSVNWMNWYDSLQQQKQIQLETHKLNKQIIEQQIEMMKLKNQRLRDGKALIQINADNLQAHLVAILLELVKNLHIWADESGQEVLWGG
ncbi:MAG: phage tail tape measure protein [Chloroflexota bacterium]